MQVLLQKSESIRKLEKQFAKTWTTEHHIVALLSWQLYVFHCHRNDYPAFNHSNCSKLRALLKNLVFPKFGEMNHPLYHQSHVLQKNIIVDVNNYNVHVVF